MTDLNADVQTRYEYSPFGSSQRIQGSTESDFQFCGYYAHLRSGLSLTLRRAYNSKAGRWLSRDPIEERDGSNFNVYVGNDPLNFADPEGTNAVAGAITGGSIGGSIGGPVGAVVGGIVGAIAAGAAAWGAGQIVGGMINNMSNSSGSASSNSSASSSKEQSCPKPCPPNDDDPENTDFISCINYCDAHCNDSPENIIRSACVAYCGDKWLGE